MGVAALIHLVVLSNQVECNLAMKRLYEDLFTDYNHQVLPTASNKTKVTVSIGLKLGQILDLNLKQQILSTNVWVEQTWVDSKLQWEPEQYDMVDMIHIPVENIWIPDIVLLNNADGNYELTLIAKARLYSNGTVVWRPPTMFHSTCEIDVEYFPFDIQICHLIFGSWTYAGDEVELRHTGNKTKVEVGIDLSQFYKNVEWDIIDVPAYYNDFYYDCCAEPFPTITFKIVIRRKMLFYLVNLILPVALMTFMTVSVFYLPSDSNEKVTLSISILTSLIVFFLLMLEIIPASSLAVPLFGKYLLFTLVLVSLSACVSVYVLNLHHRSPSIHSMSPRVRQIFLKTLPKLLRLNQPDPRERSSLNRFRKKKVAQQLLKASATATNKVYDLAQPIANSLNLIETLHKSYAFNPTDDGLTHNEEDEGRYFRRYVDECIKNLKSTDPNQSRSGQVSGDYSQRSCCHHNPCCSKFNQLQVKKPRVALAGSQNFPHSDKTSGNPDQYLPSSINQLFPTSYDCSIFKAGSKGLNDTFDMTFDYEDQVNEINQKNTKCSSYLTRPVGQKAPATGHSQNIEVPTPPPPPRQLAQLSDTLKSSGQSSCSRQNFHLKSLDNNISNGRKNFSSANHDEEVDGQLVDKLIHSINLINNASDEIDTTNTTSNNDQEDHDDLAYSPLANTGFRSSNPEQATHMTAYGTISPLCLNQQSGNYSSFTSTEQQVESCDCSAYMRNQNRYFNEDVEETTNIQHRIRNHCGESSTGMGKDTEHPSGLLLSLRLPYDQMPAHVRAAIRSILFIADTIKNEDDENSAIEDWESMSMVVDRLFLWLFLLLCTFGSVIILALAPSLYDERAPIDDKLRIEIPVSNCSASFKT